MLNDPQPGSARRKRSASARPFAAKSSARSACSLPPQPVGHPDQRASWARARLLLGLSDRLRGSGDLLAQRLALRLRLLGSLEQIGVVEIRVGHL
jgi:hypothetical protein